MYNIKFSDTLLNHIIFQKLSSEKTKTPALLNVGTSPTKNGVLIEIFQSDVEKNDIFSECVVAKIPF